MEQREKQIEEAKRDKAWNCRQRWEVLQRTIGWADAQQPLPRNSPRGCLAHARRRCVNPRMHSTALSGRSGLSNRIRSRYQPTCD